jgi:hypothetical protein
MVLDQLVAMVLQAVQAVAVAMTLALEQQEAEQQIKVMLAAQQLFLRTLPAAVAVAQQASVVQQTQLTAVMAVQELHHL